MELDVVATQLPQLIKLSPMAMCVSDPRLPDNPVVACNQAFTDLTGYAEAEIVGRNCRFLSREEKRPQLAERIRASVAERKGFLFDVLNYRKDGTPFHNAVLVAPMFDAAGELLFFLGSQVEVSAKFAESGVQGARRAAALAQVEGLSPRQKEILVMMSQGQLNKQIAYTLNLSEKTVKMHRALVIQRLGVPTSADAVRVAVEAGL